MFFFLFCSFLVFFFFFKPAFACWLLYVRDAWIDDVVWMIKCLIYIPGFSPAFFSKQKKSLLHKQNKDLSCFFYIFYLQKMVAILLKKVIVATSTDAGTWLLKWKIVTVRLDLDVVFAAFRILYLQKFDVYIQHVLVTFVLRRFCCVFCNKNNFKSLKFDYFSNDNLQEIHCKKKHKWVHFWRYPPPKSLWALYGTTVSKYGE